MEIALELIHLGVVLSYLCCYTIYLGLVFLMQDGEPSLPFAFRLRMANESALMFRAGGL